MARFGSVSNLTVALLLAGGSCAWGQSAISAHSGMVNYVEGKVLLDGQQVDPKFGQFPEVKNDQVVETAEGRAELLLTPGVFLRLAENSSFKMLSNKLSDTALEIRSGSAIVEVDELMRDNAITVRYKDSTISLAKVGLYRLDSDDPGHLRVYEGDAQVTYGLKTVQVHKGKQVQLNETLLSSSFDTKDTDAFYRWVSRRSEYIATANVSSAHAAGHYGLSNAVPCTGQASTTSDPNTLFANGSGSYCNPYGDPYGYNSFYGLDYGYSPYGAWIFNPYYGMFTYLPGMGYGYSPFGWTIYSPVTVGMLYSPGFYRPATAAGLRTNPGVINRGVGPTALTGSRMNASSPMTSAGAIGRASSFGPAANRGASMGPVGSGSVGGSSSGAGARSGGAPAAAPSSGSSMSGGGGRGGSVGGGGGHR